MSPSLRSSMQWITKVYFHHLERGYTGDILEVSDCEWKESLFKYVVRKMISKILFYKCPIWYGRIGQADSLGAIGWIEILVTLSELQICTVCLISWHCLPVLERLQVASREGHQDNFQICWSFRYRQHLHFQFQKQNLKLRNVNMKGDSASASYRLERWSTFVGDAMEMVFFFKQNDTNA